MHFQDLLNSPAGIAFVLGLGKIIPPGIGYPFAEWLGRMVASLKKNSMVKAVRSNQWVVSGLKFNSHQLDEITRQTFEHTAVCLYDLYHNLNQPKRIMEMVTLSAKLINTLEQRKKAKNGTLILAPHLSNFDLAGRAIAIYGFPILVLTYPNPPGGYQWQNKMRRDFGLEVMPMSFESMRLARERLKNKGMVLTGLDRPMESSNHQPHFFGHAAPVPVTYVNLASQGGADFVVVACQSTARGKYITECSDVIPFHHETDKDREYITNAELLLKEAEKMIKLHPQQWSMFYPVWRWALEQMP